MLDSIPTEFRSASDAHSEGPVVFLSYAREDENYTLRMADALRLKGVEVRGDWQLVRGEAYERQLQDLQLGADALVFILSPDSVQSSACFAELKYATTQRNRILPVLIRDIGALESRLPKELSSPQWTFLRRSDDFIAGIQGLVEAINTDFDLMPEHRRLLQSAEIWQRNARSGSYLLRKEGLKRSEDWLAKTGADPNRLPKPTSLQLEYLRASRSAQERGSRIALTVATFIALAMMVLAIIAFLQRQQAQQQKKTAEANAEEATRQKGFAFKNAKEADKRRVEAEEQRNYAIWQGLLREANHHLDDGNEELAALLTCQALLFYRSTPGRPKLAIEESLLKISELPYFAGQLQASLDKDSEVSSVAFSPDGTRLAAGFDIEDHSVRVWDVLRPGKPPLVLKGQGEGVRSVAFSSDGIHLASSNRDGKIRVWNSRHPSAAPLLLKGNGGVAFSPDGTRLAAGNSVWNLRHLSDPPLVLRENNAGSSSGGVPSFNDGASVAFSPDGVHLASIKGATIRVWDLRAVVAEPLALRSGTDFNQVYSVAFSPDGTRLASGGDDSQVRLWDLRHPSIPPQVLSGHHQRVMAVAFSRDGAKLASASGDETIRIWSVGSPNSPPLILKGHKYEVSSVAFSPDGTHLASGGQDKSVRLWDLRQPSAPSLLIGGDDDEVDSIAFSPKGTRLASATEDNVIRLWDLQRPTSRPEVLKGHQGKILTVAFSPEGKYLASGSEDKRIRLWDLDRPGTPPIVFSGHKDAVVAVAFSPEGTLLASAGLDKTIQLWNLHRPKSAPVTLIRQRAIIYALAFSPDGTRIASASDDHKVRVWKLLEPDTPPAVFTNPEDRVTAVAFSPDGRLLAAGSGRGTIQIWDLDRPKIRPDLTFDDQSEDTVYFVAFSPDASLLVSASGPEDGGVRLWDIKSPKAPPLVLGGEVDPAGAIALSTDGTRLAINDSAAGPTQIWDLWTRSADHLCAMVTRNLSIDEWYLYAGEDVPYQRTCPSFPPGRGASQ
jgi:WD40 repeat protein